jgi:hypothetical protein
LAFRNTIKVPSELPRFKIIDFDKSFKVVPTEEKDEAYNSTKDILDFWLKFRFDEKHPRAPFAEISVLSSHSSESHSCTG